MKVSFIIPTYNEKDNILILIKEIIKNIKKTKDKYEVIVVDDDSSDKTGYICEEYFSKDKGIKVYIRTKDKGFASAIYYGIKKSTGNIIFVMDADFSHDPKLINLMLEEIKKCDIVIASRYKKNGGGENKQRFMLSKLYNLYLRLLLGVNITDFLFGYFCIRKSYLLKNNLITKKVFSGFGDYFIRFAYAINGKSGRFIEIPAFYKNRTHGQSKSNLLKMLFTYTLTSFEMFLQK